MQKFDSLCKKKFFKDLPKFDVIKPDKHVEKIFSTVFTGMGGRYTRLRILCEIIESPMNMMQISKQLDLDYKTVQYNMKILHKNNFVVRKGNGYGDLFSPSELVLSNLSTLYVVIRKVEERLMNSKKFYIE